MDKTVYVLLGVALSVLLNAIKELWFQKDKNKKDREYLAIRISCILDTFVNGCADVVADDGLCYGQPDQDGHRSIQTKTPSFDPLSVEVEWKTLPARLMFEVLSLPNQIEAANRKISWTFESASPPDYEEGFEERQLQYAALGLMAHRLASRLRSIGMLPPQVAPAPEEWNPVQLMEASPTELLCLTAFPTPHGRNSRDGYCLRRPSRPRSTHPSDITAVTWIPSQMTLRPVRHALQVPYGCR